MTVYYLRRKIDGAIKIGFTDRSPSQRARELSNASGLEVELLASEPGTRQDERETLAEFAEERIRGEWFRPSPILLGYIDFIQERAT